MKNSLKVINDLKNDGVIEDYAIGGGIGALFYIEPFLTYDLDVFIVLSEKIDKKSLISLSPIYDYLKSKGYSFRGEHIIIEGVPVQFIPTDELAEEAVLNARELNFEEEKTRVIAPEYLIAILVKVGRKKDIDKIEKLIQQAKIDKRKLGKILEKYNLTEKSGLLRRFISER